MSWNWKGFSLSNLFRSSFSCNVSYTHRNKLKLSSISVNRNLVRGPSIIKKTITSWTNFHYYIFVNQSIMQDFIIHHFAFATCALKNFVKNLVILFLILSWCPFFFTLNYIPSCDRDLCDLQLVSYNINWSILNTLRTKQ